MGAAFEVGRLRGTGQLFLAAGATQSRDSFKLEK